MVRIYIPIVLAASLAGTSALAQTSDHPPTDIASAEELHHDKNESWTFIQPGVNLANIVAVQVDPTVVYAGSDAQFENVSAEDRRAYAQLMTEALRAELPKSFRLASRAGPGTLRIRLTLIGAKKTTVGVGTVSSVMPLGLVTNAVKSVAGKKGTFSGSILYAAEIFDAQSGALVAAAVRRAAPDALDIRATVSTTDTVRSVAGDIAKKLRERLVEAKTRGPS